MEIITDSIEYHLNELSQTWVGVAQNLISTDSIKAVIDVLTNLSEVVANVTSLLGGFGTAATALGAGLSATVGGLFSYDFNTKQVTGLVTQLKNLGNLTISPRLQKSLKSLDISTIATAKDLTFLTKDVKGANTTFREWASKVNESGEAVAGGSSALEDYKLYLDGVNKSLNKATVQSKLFSAATKAISAVSWIAAITLVTQAISALSSAIDDYVHRVDNAREALDDWKSELTEMEDSLAEHRSAVSDIIDSYDDLAKGVNTLNNTNISLSDEDYAEFIEMNNTLAETFPELKSGIDDNGNAIIDLGNNAESAAEKVRELLQAEEDAANFKIAQNLDETFENVKTVIDDDIKSLEEFNAQYENLQAQSNIAMGEIAPNENGVFSLSIDTSDAYGEQVYNAFMGGYEQFLDGLDKTARKELSGAFSMSQEGDLKELEIDLNNFDIATLEFLNATMQDYIGEMNMIISDEMGDVSQNINEISGEITDEWNSMIDQIVSAMKSKNSYKELDEAGQQIADALTGFLSYDTLNGMSANDIYNYIRNTIIEPISHLTDDQKIQMGDLIDTNSGLTPLQKVEIAQNLKDSLGDIDLDLDFVLSGDIDGSAQSYLDDLNESIGHLTESTTEGYQELIDLTSDFTEEQIEAWLEVTEGIDKASDAIKAWNEYLEDSNEAIEEMEEYASLTIDEVANAWSNLNSEIDQIQTSYNAVIAAQDEYNQYGYLTLDTLQSLLSISSDYLACLIDENGQLQLNSQAYQLMVEQKLADAEATAVDQAIAELNAIAIQGETEETGEYVSANAVLAESLDALGGHYLYLRDTALEAAQAQALSAALGDAMDSGADIEQVERVMSNLDAELALIRSTSTAATTSVGGLSNAINGFSDAASSAGSSAGSTAKATDDTTDATDELTNAIQDEIDALEELKSHLEDVKSEYEDLYDAIMWFYDNWIDDLDDTLDDLDDAQDNMDDVLAAIDREYENQINILKEQLDALSDAADEEDRLYQIEQARKALADAQKNRTVMQYQEGLGFVYTVDTNAIAEAEQTLADLEAEQAQAEIEAELQAQIDLLEEYRNMWAEIPDYYEQVMQEIAAANLLGENWATDVLNPSEEALLSFRDTYVSIQQDITSNEEEKARIEELEDLWEDAKNAYRDSQYEAQLASFFGSDYEYELLYNSAQWRIKFADEYSDVCTQIEDIDSQIEALESQLADVVEEAAEEIVEALDDVSDALGSTGGGVKNLQSTLDDTEPISYYIWTDEDEVALLTAQDRLNHLNNLIGDDMDSSLITSRDQLQAFIDAFTDLREGRITTEELIDCINDLSNSEDDCVSGLHDVFNETADRLNDAANYTDTLTEYVRGGTTSIEEFYDKLNASNAEYNNMAENAKITVEEIDTDAQQAAQSVGILGENTYELHANTNSLLNTTDDLVEDTRNKAEVTANTVQTVGSSLEDVNEGQAELESNTEETISDISDMVDSTIEDLDRLSESLANLALSRSELETYTEELVTEADESITNVSEIVDEINSAIEELKSAIEELKNSLIELTDQMSSLDSVSLSNVISQIGFGADNGGSLIGSINQAIDAVSGSNGIAAQIEAFNNEATLENIISQFNGDESIVSASNEVIDIITGEVDVELENLNAMTLTDIIDQFNGGDSLLSSINDVIETVAGAGGLIEKINSISETISNINAVKSGFDSLDSQVSSCISSVKDLQSQINALQDKTVTITVNYVTNGSAEGLATGTAFTGGKSYKQGKSYAKGTVKSPTKFIGKSYESGDWGLSADQPNSLVGEAGTEILVRDGSYYTVDSPQVMDLKRGDIIFNALQSAAILQNGNNATIQKLADLVPDLSNIIFEGKSFANGTTKFNDFDIASQFNALYDSLSNVTLTPEISFKGSNNFDKVQKRSGDTVIQINGNLEFPNIKSGNDAEKLISELSNLSTKAVQRAGKW